MKPFIVKDIINICNGNLICGDLEISCENFSKDTRTINDGDVYISIKGDNFDGNSFYKDAFSKGASVALLDESYSDIEIVEGKTIITVKDTVIALQTLASYRRSLYDIPVIAVTGSAGKTSVRDMIYAVLKNKYNVLKADGNYNNHIGLPLTLLRLKEHDAVILEMGMDKLGEISLLTNIAKPNLGIITNIGTAHIGNLGSKENILKAKLEILEGLNGPLIVNNDDEHLNNLNIKNRITCGINNDSDIKVDNIIHNETMSTYDVTYENNTYNFNLPIGTNQFIMNSLMAIVVGLKLNVPIEDIKQGISNFDLTKNRMEIIKNDRGFDIINDTYNANYDSMKNAIDYLKTYHADRKIVILGDMLELGEYDKELHEKVGEYVSDSNIDYLIAIGNSSVHISNKAMEKGMKHVYYFETKLDSYQFINDLLKEHDAVLVKASNGSKFIDIVEYLKTI